MDIVLKNIGKRYRFEWIFRGVNLQLPLGTRLAITGPNGSGKSTLLKVVSGYLSPTRGDLFYTKGKARIPREWAYKSVAYAAPYIDIIEEFTLVEFLDFHQKFIPFTNKINTSKALEILGFSKSAHHKPIQNFSSGMKQRVKLLATVCSQRSILLLDEPSTNLDRQGIDWYLALINSYAMDKTVLVASNVVEDYGFCGEHLHIPDFKGKA